VHMRVRVRAFHEHAWRMRVCCTGGACMSTQGSLCVSVFACVCVSACACACVLVRVCARMLCPCECVNLQELTWKG